MKVHIAIDWCKYEGISGILKVFSDFEKANKYKDETNEFINSNKKKYYTLKDLEASREKEEIIKYFNYQDKEITDKFFYSLYTELTKEEYLKITNKVRSTFTEEEIKILDFDFVISEVKIIGVDVE